MPHLKKNIREPKPEPGGGVARIGVAGMGWAGDISMPKERRITRGRVDSVVLEWFEPAVVVVAVAGRPWAVMGVGSDS